jgi:hypothetical protein
MLTYAYYSDHILPSPSFCSYPSFFAYWTASCRSLSTQRDQSCR